MTNFSGTDKCVEGVTSIPVRYTLYGDIVTALERNGASVDELVTRAFLELANVGNSFDLIYHNFDMEFETETLSFSCASLRYKPEGEIDFTVSLVDGPMTFDVGELPEDTRAFLAEIEAQDKTKQ